MSKNYTKRNNTLSKKDDFDNLLKETRQSDLQYKTAKNIKIEDLKNNNQNNNNKISNKLSKQLGNINIKIKDNNNEDVQNQDNNNKESDENNLKILEDIKKENEKYIEKIKELEEKITKMNEEYIINQKTNKTELEHKEKQNQKLIITNKNLKNSLELLTKRLDKAIINSNLKHVKIQKNTSESQELKHQLEIKEKELKNQQQLINILKKDNKNIREILNTFHMNVSDLNLANKVQLQYREIMNLQKDLKEYKKLAKSSSQENIKFKNLKLSQEDNKNNNDTKKNKKLFLNVISPKKNLKAFNLNLNTFNKNKFEKNENSSFKKRNEYQGLNSYINKENNILEKIFSVDERDSLKNILGEGERLNNFINKLNVLDKAAIIKEKEMSLKIKVIENELKQKERELNKSIEQIKEKNNIISDLSIKNKELTKNVNELVNQINNLSQLLTELDQKNEHIIKENIQIKSTIFNIDGIIESKTNEGNIIPILKNNKDNNDEIYSDTKENEYPKKYNNFSKNETFKESKNKSFSISNSNE